MYADGLDVFPTVSQQVIVKLMILLQGVCSFLQESSKLRYGIGER